LYRLSLFNDLGLTSSSASSAYPKYAFIAVCGGTPTSMNTTAATLVFVQRSRAYLLVIVPPGA